MRGWESRPGTGPATLNGYRTGPRKHIHLEPFDEEAVELVDVLIGIVWQGASPIAGVHEKPRRFSGQLLA